jgi:hypothetical protein
MYAGMQGLKHRPYALFYSHGVFRRSGISGDEFLDAHKDA